MKLKFLKYAHTPFEIINKPTCKTIKLGKHKTKINKIWQEKYQISKAKINEQRRQNYAARKCKISDANLDDLLYNGKNNEKQQKEFVAKEKAVDNFSFDVPLHENMKAQKR